MKELKLATNFSRITGIPLEKLIDKKIILK